MLRALKALGLFNLNSFSSTDRIGVSGSSIVDSTIIVDKRVIYFVVENCHIIFILFVGGNVVSAVEYVSHV